MNYLIYVMQMLLSLSIILTSYLFLKNSKIKTMRYIVFWFFIIIGVTLRMFADFQMFDNICKHLKILSLVFNSFSYVILISIFKCHDKEENVFNILFNKYFIDICIIIYLIYFFNMPTYVFTLYNVFIIVKAFMFSVKHKRFYFMLMTLFTGIYFLLITVNLINETNVNQIWMLNIFAVIFGVIGVYVNGGKYE